MKKNRLFYILILLMVTMFGFRLDVYAAQELTCVYEKDSDGIQLMFTQDSKGNRVFYLKKSNEKKWEKQNHFNHDFDHRENISPSDHDVYYDVANNPKICPIHYTTYGNVFNNTSNTGGEVPLLTEELKIKKFSSDELKTTSTNKKVPEFTCIYTKVEGLKKVAIVQSSSGITIYKNKENVGYDDQNSYWNIENPKIEWGDTGYEERENYLEQCPGSLTTKTDGKGTLVLYSTTGGKSSLIPSKNGGTKWTYGKVMTFSQLSHSTTGDVDTNKLMGMDCQSLSLSDKMIQDDYSGYKQSCLYEHTYKNDDKTWCHVIQIDVGPGFRFSNSEDYRNDAFKVSTYPDGLTEDQFIKNDATNRGMCPSMLKVNRNIVESEIFTTVSFDGLGETYSLVPDGGRGESLTIPGLKVSSDFVYNIKFHPISITTCDELFGNDETLKSTLKTLVTVVKIVIPIILLVLGSLDFAQAVFASNEDGIKKSQSKFIKRLIIAVIIFLIPSILQVILTIANSVWGNIDPSLCGII